MAKEVTLKCDPVQKQGLSAEIGTCLACNKLYRAASKLTEVIPVITKWKNKTLSGPWQVP